MLVVGVGRLVVSCGGVSCLVSAAQDLRFFRAYRPKLELPIGLQNFAASSVRFALPGQGTDGIVDAEVVGMLPLLGRVASKDSRRSRSRVR